VLRRGLFEQLKIGNYTERGLAVFSEENFLVDTIKCRLEKGKSKVPIEIINNCVRQFLREEIESIHSKRIVLLGDTARRGLVSLSEFNTLNQCRVKRDCGKIIRVKDYIVILYVYPSTRNTNEMKAHPLLELLRYL
jgi:uracil-DNA glycosylase